MTFEPPPTRYAQTRDGVDIAYLQPGIDEPKTYEQATETFSGELLVARQGLKLEI